MIVKNSASKTDLIPPPVPAVSSWVLALQDELGPLRELLDIAAMAEGVFEGEEAAKQWLCAPNRAFSGDAPIDYLDTEPGAKAVRQVLNAIATGGAL
jgi:uncharacterized protein (DUF2384 family)